MHPASLPILQGKRLDLVPLAEEHAEKIVLWRNDPAVRDNMLNRTPLTLEGHNEWYRRYRGDETDASFVMRRREGALVGTVALYHIDNQQKTAELGRVLVGDPASRRLGLAREASQMLLDYAFERLALRRVNLVVVPENKAAAELYRSLGFIFVREGQRDSQDGHTRSVIFMTMASPKG